MPVFLFRQIQSSTKVLKDRTPPSKDAGNPRRPLMPMPEAQPGLRRHAMLALALATIPLSSLSASPSGAEKQETPAPAVPTFVDGQAQVVEAFKDPKEWIRHDLWVETEFDSDGDGKLDRVHVSVTRPKQTDTEGLKLPVVYESSPYYAGTSPDDRNFFWNPRHELGSEPPHREDPPPHDAKIERPIISNSQLQTWVPRGYIVVHSSSPGTGLSQGCPTVGGDNESLAPKAVIDWLCGRAKGYREIDSDETVEATWCTGKVGMTGTSYNGTIPLAAATTGVEGLEAIIPIAPNTSYYHYYRSNGLVRHPGGWMGEDIDVLYNYIHSGNPDRREWCDCEIRDKEMRENLDRVSGDYNEFWAKRDYLLDLKPMRAALLMAHGFNDWNVVPEHSIRIYEAALAKGIPTQLYMHQGGHGGPPPIEMMNRWFTYFLHEVDNGVLNDPPVRIVRENDKREEPTAYTAYPHPESQRVVLAPVAGGHQIGKLAIEDHSVLESTPPTNPNRQGTETLVDNFSFPGKVLAQAPWTHHRLLYASNTLQRPLHLSGTAKIKIRLACNKPAANLSVWLIALPWEEGEKVKITDNIITRGWADPQNSGNPSLSKPLTPGEFIEFEFSLQPDDQVIPAGQQIALMIFSSDQEFTLHPSPGTELTVDLDATRLSLPVVGGLEAYKDAFTAPTPAATSQAGTN